ncbi:EF-hand domain-containing protein [Yoonia sp.]|uniref:EF-hand domain-containing protein n=1 Tax=Yoonia sp. TaxID=2212373 RepID=UPI0019F38133|nr:EF-hand domain-containing protein [Yoonia sp.]MBE0413804.1 EF-hand domain-containing protein [Yoonia sp.]
MKRKTILTLTAAAVIAAIAIPAVANNWGPGQMRHGSDGGFMQDHRGEGHKMRNGGHGRMGNMADHPVYQSFDTDGDGTVSAEEFAAGRAALHAEHDTDGDGALSSEEFATLFAQMTRDMADRRFAQLDADSDGLISADEMARPAQMMSRKEMRQPQSPDAPAQ